MPTTTKPPRPFTAEENALFSRFAKFLRSKGIKLGNRPAAGPERYEMGNDFCITPDKYGRYSKPTTAPVVTPESYAALTARLDTLANRMASDRLGTPEQLVSGLRAEGYALNVVEFAEAVSDLESREPRQREKRVAELRLIHGDTLIRGRAMRYMLDRPGCSYADAVKAVTTK